LFPIAPPKKTTVSRFCSPEVGFSTCFFELSPVFQAFCRGPGSLILIFVCNPQAVSWVPFFFFFWFTYLPNGALSYVILCGQLIWQPTSLGPPQPHVSFSSPGDWKFIPVPFFFRPFSHFPHPTPLFDPGYDPTCFEV